MIYIVILNFVMQNNNSVNICSLVLVLFHFFKVKIFYIRDHCKTYIFYKYAREISCANCNSNDINFT